MKLARSPFLVGIVIAAFGVGVHAITAVLLFEYPSRFLDPAETQAYLDVWFQPVATIGNVLVFKVTPLLALVAGFALVYVAGQPIKPVVKGLMAGSLLFALGVVLLGWVVTSPQIRPTAVEAANGVGQMIVLMGGPAVLAAGLGHYLGHRPSATPN